MPFRMVTVQVHVSIEKILSSDSTSFSRKPRRFSRHRCDHTFYLNIFRLYTFCAHISYRNSSKSVTVKKKSKARVPMRYTAVVVQRSAFIQPVLDCFRLKVNITSVKHEKQFFLTHHFISLVA